MENHQQTLKLEGKILMNQDIYRLQVSLKNYLLNTKIQITTFQQRNLVDTKVNIINIGITDNKCREGQAITSMPKQIT